MYAIFEDGSHQFRVHKGDCIIVDRREGEPGTDLIFPKVLLVAGPEGAAIGTPVVEGASVGAKIVSHLRSKKSIIQKFRHRKNYRRRTGHRQPQTMVQITSLPVPT
jgi:large subunit ribosomal protein L21